jgi:hypothetical protein
MDNTGLFAAFFTAWFPPFTYYHPAPAYLW